MNAPRGNQSGTQTTKAILLVAIAVIVGVLTLSHTSTTSHTATPPANSTPSTTVPPTVTTSTTTTIPPPTPTSVKVLVFNGTTAPHGAGYFMTKLKALSYDTLAPENGTTTTVTTSMVYVNVPGYMSSALQIAQALGLPATDVQSSLPDSAPVPQAVVKTNSPDVVVLVGSDISGQSLGGSTSTTTSTSGSTTTSTAG